jgi:hypothetical protein
MKGTIVSAVILYAVGWFAALGWVVTSFVPVLWLLGGLALVALFVWASLRYLDDARPHLGWAVAALVALALLAAGLGVR